MCCVANAGPPWLCPAEGTMEGRMNASKLPLLSAAALFLLSAGCSDGALTTSRPPAIEAIPGGGTRGGALTNALGVVVLDATTDAPLQGVAIWLGEGSRAKAVGSTDDRGDLRVDQLALNGARAANGSVAVTAVKSGFVTTSYVGVDRETVTIALHPVVE